LARGQAFTRRRLNTAHRAGVSELAQLMALN
jgi:hypothetical protein